MDALTLGFIAIGLFVVLAFLGLPIALSFMVVGFGGIVYLRGWESAASILGQIPYAAVASYLLATIPLFVLMGQLAFHSGISTDLFNSAHKWTSKRPGGLALATMLACTGFAAVTGSSVASAATMGAVAYPEMRKFNYDPRLATGTIAAGGTLGILIPPSTIFIILGIITQTSIGELFVAGLLPGIMMSFMFLTLIVITCKRNPKLGPPGQGYSMVEKLKSLKGIWGMLVLFALVLGGLYFGWFAPSEAGTIGAFGAFALALLKRTKTSSLVAAFKESAQTTAYILLIIIGATVFNILLALGGVSSALSHWILSFNVPSIVTIIIILLLYIPIGMFIDPLGGILLTVPVFFPVITTLGYDPVWFLVMVCMMTELGLITPPVAINVYVVQGVTKVPMDVVFRGILPFAIVFLVGIALLVAFPQISLLLVHGMR